MESNSGRNRKDDIAFLKKFYDKVDEYLFLGFAPPQFGAFYPEGRKEMNEALKEPEFQKLHKNINGMKNRVNRLLDECGVDSVLEINGMPHEIVNLITNNITIYKWDKKNFLDPISEAIGVLEENPPGNQMEKAKRVPFISMSFRDEDKDVNEYFMRILDALEIKYITAERYSREGISDKVRKLIEQCNLVIAIYVKKYEITTGEFITSEWLTKEYGSVWGKEMDIIPLVEEGIEDIAGLKSEREIIQFDRNNLQKMKNATIKFLEALKEHHLV